MYEGSTEMDPKVGKWCGTNKPSDYQSNGNVVLIVFKSDWSASFEGFRVSYELGELSVNWFFNILKCNLISISVCGGKFDDETGTLLSPLYPNQYEESRTCHYEIDAPVGKAITLDFVDFDLEDNSYPSCYFDYLAVRVMMTQLFQLVFTFFASRSTMATTWIAVKSDVTAVNKGPLERFLASMPCFWCFNRTHPFRDVVSKQTTPWSIYVSVERGSISIHSEILNSVYDF